MFQIRAPRSRRFHRWTNRVNLHRSTQPELGEKALTVRARLLRHKRLDVAAQVDSKQTLKAVNPVTASSAVTKRIDLVSSPLNLHRPTSKTGNLDLSTLSDAQYAKTCISAWLR
jgi:hypothetical protein